MRLKLVKDGRLNTCVYLCSLLKSHQYSEGIFLEGLDPQGQREKETRPQQIWNLEAEAEKQMGEMSMMEQSEGTKS